MKKLIYIAILLSAAFWLNASAEPAPAKDAVNNPAVEISTGKSRYHSDEKIQITIRVTNKSKEETSSYYPSSQKYDLIVKDKNGKEVWRWSRGKMFLMAISPFKLKPKESIKFVYSWDQKDNSRRQVSAGKYSIIGELAVVPRVRSREISIEIIKMKK